MLESRFPPEFPASESGCIRTRAAYCPFKKYISSFISSLREKREHRIDSLNTCLGEEEALMTRISTGAQSGECPFFSAIMTKWNGGFDEEPCMMT